MFLAFNKHAKSHYNGKNHDLSLPLGYQTATSFSPDSKLAELYALLTILLIYRFFLLEFLILVPTRVVAPL
jgi:hypothetical protein